MSPNQTGPTLSPGRIPKNGSTLGLHDLHSRSFVQSRIGGSFLDSAEASKVCLACAIIVGAAGALNPSQLWFLYFVLYGMVWYGMVWYSVV